MKKTVKTLNSLKDSRILFDKQPPAFGYLFILIVGVFLCSALIWSIFTSKVYTIQSSGIVTSKDANYVMCTYTGEIDECYMEEGTLVEKGDTLFTVKSTEYNLQEEQLVESRKFFEVQISQNELLVKSIKDDKNYFDETKPEDSLYYNTFEAYKSKVEQNKVDASTYQFYGYTNEQIEPELEKNQSRINEVYYSTIQTAENTIAQAKQQISTIDSQLVAIAGGRGAYEVKATATGVLHMLEDYKSGMVVQTTAAVATITPENSSRIVETYVPTEDMARMKEGDSVQIVIDGLSQAVYGTIKGTVEQIASNITMQQDSNGQNRQMFKVLISMDTDYLVSQNGDKVDIINGMTSVVRIQYDKVTYFRYMLEKLGFKAK